MPIRFRASASPRRDPARSRSALIPGPGPRPSLAGHVVDHQRDALELVGVAQTVLEMEGPAAIDQPAVVDLEREARRPAPDLGRVVDPQTPAVALRRRTVGGDARDEPIELWRGDPLRGAVGQPDRLPEDGGDVAPGDR